MSVCLEHVIWVCRDLLAHRGLFFSVFTKAEKQPIPGAEEISACTYSANQIQTRFSNPDSLELTAPTNSGTAVVF